MRLQVLYFSTLKQAAGIDEETLELPTGASLRDLLTTLSARHPALIPHLPSLLLTRNQEWSAPSELLADGDEVGLMPPVSGG